MKPGIIQIKLKSKTYFLSLDMFVVTQFMYDKRIPMEDFGNLVQQFFLLYELFFLGVARGMEEKNKEFTLNFKEFGKQISAHPTEFKKCFEKFQQIQEGFSEMIGAPDMSDLTDKELEHFEKTGELPDGKKN